MLHLLGIAPAGPGRRDPIDHRIRGLRIGTLAMFAIAVPTVVRYWLLGLPLLAGAVVATMLACSASLGLTSK